MIDADWIKNITLSLGADDCGLVSLSEQHASSWHIETNALLHDVKTVIVFYKKFPRYIYDSNEVKSYNQDFSDMIFFVDRISQILADKIESAGYRALAIASDDETEPGRGTISLRHYAVLAGLGSIGKNSLLLTPRFGSMVELGAVITDMTLNGDFPIEKGICIPGCYRCIQSCPKRALGDVKTQVNCCKETIYIEENGDSLSMCWLCRSSCPLNMILAKKQ
jgi:epoxyqueuosine reductase QueG